MILSDEIIIKVSNKTKSYFKIKGYDTNLKYITVKIKDFPKSSKQIILVKCDICQKERKLSFAAYNKNKKNETDIYCCHKCCTEKRKKTNLKRFGVEYVLLNKEIKEKSNQTKIKKYGDKNYTNRKLYKETLLKKYGVENISQINEIKNKKIKTTLINYGVEYPSQNKEIERKIETTKLERYDDNGYHNVEKMKLTNLELYGCENVFQNQKVKDKIAKTNLDKWGCKNPGESEYIKNKIKNIKIKNGNQIPDCDLTEFKKYRKLVSNYTNKNKKELFKNWNGYDYYDQEYIKGNFVYDKYNYAYPTIDHKISVYYGFINNVDSKEISKLENLCITKRYINSKKNKKCFYERKEKN